MPCVEVEPPSRGTIPPGVVVLVVDDEPDIGEMVRTSLELKGACVHAVQRGEQAVAECGKTHFDAAFVDFTMPGLSGHELVAEMLAVQPDLPIIYMSGFDVENHGTMTDFLKKPFDLDDIQEKLRHALKLSKAH
jgi:DNA-binding NtrC family response regulator